MTLYQRGRTWYIDFYANGSRVQQNAGIKNKREGEKFNALRISEVEREVLRESCQDQPFRQAVHEPLPNPISAYG